MPLGFRLAWMKGFPHTGMGHIRCASLNGRVAAPTPFKTTRPPTAESPPGFVNKVPQVVLSTFLGVSLFHMWLSVQNKRDNKSRDMLFEEVVKVVEKRTGMISEIVNESMKRDHLLKELASSVKINKELLLELSVELSKKSSG